MVQTRWYNLFLPSLYAKYNYKRGRQRRSLKCGKRQANRLGTAGLEEQYSSRASYDTPSHHHHFYATEEGGPGPMFPNPQLATDGNSGRHIHAHVRTGVLLTIPGHLAAPTRRTDQDPRDNENAKGSTAELPKSTLRPSRMEIPFSHLEARGSVACETASPSHRIAPAGTSESPSCTR